MGRHLPRKPKRKRMLWPWPPRSRGEILAILIGAIFVVMVLVAMVKFPMYGRQENASFGPEWDCAADVPYGGCVKRTAPSPR
jgi:hypothetical protein